LCWRVTYFNRTHFRDHKDEEKCFVELSVVFTQQIADDPRWVVFLVFLINCHTELAAVWPTYFPPQSPNAQEISNYIIFGVFIEI
jgi:hypothetical protein